VDEYIQLSESPIPPVEVPSGPVKDVRYVGEDVDLDVLPVVTHAPRDSGAYFTGGVGLARDPGSGAVNAGIYRMQIRGRNELSVPAGPTHDLGRILQTARAAGRSVDFAVVLGYHPALSVASQAKVPITYDSLGLTGAFLRQPMPVVAAETVDVPVP